jgi:hypothetical protein
MLYFKIYHPFSTKYESNATNCYDVNDVTISKSYTRDCCNICHNFVLLNYYSVCTPVAQTKNNQNDA